MRNHSKKELLEPKIPAIGDKLRIGGRIYILAEVDRQKVALINLVTGCRWRNPVCVGDPYHMTPQEFKRVIGDSEWRIEEC